MSPTRRAATGRSRSRSACSRTCRTRSRFWTRCRRPATRASSSVPPATSATAPRCETDSRLGLGARRRLHPDPLQRAGRARRRPAAMAATLDLFDAPRRRMRGRSSRTRARLRVLARPGAAATDRTVGLDEAGWRRFADGVARAAELARARGFEPTFHHHTATYVEAPWEIERMLELTDVGPAARHRPSRTRRRRSGTGTARLARPDRPRPRQGLPPLDPRRRDRGRRRHGGGLAPQRFCELGTGDVDLPRSSRSSLERLQRLAGRRAGSDPAPTRTRPRRSPHRHGTAAGSPRSRGFSCGLRSRAGRTAPRAARSRPRSA